MSIRNRILICKPSSGCWSVHWLHSIWVPLHRVISHIGMKARHSMMKLGDFRSKSRAYTVHVPILFIRHNFNWKLWLFFRLPFNANDSKVAYAVVYLFCVLASLIIASTTMTADGFYMSVCLLINVMLQRLQTLIGDLNVAFRRWGLRRVLKWISLINIFCF